jgi:GMP synthase-like glutamine amidotransferase
MSLVVFIHFDERFSKILQRFREYNIEYIKVHFSVLDFFLNSEKYKKSDIRLFYINGSIRRILRDGNVPSIDFIMKTKIPIMGVCYGFQYLAMQSGGKLEENAQILKDSHKMIVTKESKQLSVWVNHYDKVVNLPTHTVAKNAAVKALWEIDIEHDGIIYMAHTEKWIGFQFHPENNKKLFEEYMLPYLKDEKN